MARARNIKPGFFKNEDLVELPFATRLLFVGLWTLADREGRLEDRPKRIKMEIFPADDVDIEESLNELVAAGFITRYTVGADRYIEVVAFTKHQHPHQKEPASTIPKPGASPVRELDGNSAEHAVCLVLDSYSTPCKSGASPVLNSDEHNASRADSLLLIPDSPSLKPLRTLSGKPDFKPLAIEILQFLNLKAGRAYRPTEANLGFIMDRLKSGNTVSDCKQVIAKKVREWAGNPDMDTYLRPATLFNRTKFDQYTGELVETPDAP